MYAQVANQKEKQCQSVMTEFAKKQNSGKSTFQFVDNRPGKTGDGA